MYTIKVTAALEAVLSSPEFEGGGGDLGEDLGGDLGGDLGEILVVEIHQQLMRAGETHRQHQNQGTSWQNPRRRSETMIQSQGGRIRGVPHIRKVDSKNKWSIPDLAKHQQIEGLAW